MRSGSDEPNSFRSGSAGRDELGRPVLDMLGRGSSASLMAMALADGIAMLPPDVDSIERGLPLRFESFCHS